MKKSLFLILTIFSIFKSNGQNITISGHISDVISGERLINANIYDAASKKGTVSNNYGFYSLSVKKGTPISLIVSHLGYTIQKENLTLSENKVLDILLIPEDYKLKEVELTVTKDVPIEKRNEIGTLRIPTKQIKQLPALGGEVDVLKALQLMPGVQSGSEGSSGLYVRGGSPDQNLVLLDDVPLYYVNHLGGFVSTFNIDAINSIKLIKGGFPAEYGSRLSSVLDIRMKDGNMNTFKGSGMIGMVAAKLAIEGPIKKDTTSYIISARRMLYDLLTRPISKMVFDGVSVGYTFYDFNAKVNHIFSDKNRIYLSTYLGRDRSVIKLKKDTPFKNSLEWGNNLVALRWNHVFNSKLFSNATLSYTRYKFITNDMFEYNNSGNNYISSRRFLSGIYDTGAKIDFEYFVNSNYKLKFGANSIYHTFTPGITKNKTKTNGENTLNQTVGSQHLFAWEHSTYFENKLKIGRLINTNFGLRGVMYAIANKNYLSLEPRLLASALVAPTMSIKAAYSKMQQNIHLLTNNGIGIPTDLWIPSTNNIAPQQSHQYSMGVARSIKDNLYECSIESYYKTMSNLISYKEGANLIGTQNNWENLIDNSGKGISYGVEFLAQKKKGQTTGWIGYTWSKTNRQFDNINNGNTFPFKYDRRHDLSVVVTHKINDKIDVSGTWVYGSGSAFTLPIAKYDITDPKNYIPEYVTNVQDYNTTEVYVYGDRNAARMRSYHKLDIGANFRKQKKWGERVLNISLYNAYNRQNPYYYYVETVADTNPLTGDVISEKSMIKQLTQFPILPSISYSFTF